MAEGDVQFTLGKVEFRDTEIPEDLSDLGSRVNLVVHEFTGGLKTGQIFGVFDPDKEWFGELRGPDALSRKRELQRLADDTEPVDLVYGPESYRGIVDQFRAKVKSQFIVEYHIKFIVFENNSGRQSTSSAPPVAPDSVLQSSLANAGLRIQRPSVPSVTFSQPIQQAVTNLQQGVKQQLNAAAGKVSNLSTAQVQSILKQVNQVLSLLSPLSTGSDPLSAAAASDLSAIIRTIGNVFSLPASVIGTVTQQNPNLYQLSALYYGDWSKWKIIADANGLSDPQPVGNYTLKIPQLANT